MRFIDLSTDPWQRIAGEPGSSAQPDPQGRRLLTLEQWRVVRDHAPAGAPIGLVVPNTSDIDDLADDLVAHRDAIGLIVLEFPKWTDGRAYSQARQLRARHRFDGEIRASGDVLVDMLPLLQRTGFDAVVLRPDQKPDSARRALDFFAGHYQGDALQARPRFAREYA